MKLREWQAAAFPVLVNAYRRRVNGVVRGATGSGKSILLALVATRVFKPRTTRERLIITVPSKSLVTQLCDMISKKFRIRTGKFYERAKETQYPIIIACHGSLELLSNTLDKKRLHVSIWIADECHKTESPTVKRFASTIPDAWRCGFTATPHRASLRERLSLYDEMLYEYTVEQALEDGVIVPPRIVPYTGTETMLDDVCIDAISNPALKGLPGLVSAYSISDAKDFAAKLYDSGIMAAPIHSKLSGKMQNRLIAALRRGRLHCLVHVNLLTEGADMPWLRWLCIRRVPRSIRSSRNRFIQEVGRVLRKDPDSEKDCALILDPLDLFNRLDLTYEALLGESGLSEQEQPQQLEGTKRGEARSPTERKAPAALGMKQEIRSLALLLRSKGLAPTRDRGLIRASRPSRELYEEVRGALLRAAGSQSQLPASFKRMLSRYAQGWLHNKLTAGDIEDLLAILYALSSGWRPGT